MEEQEEGRSKTALIEKKSDTEGVEDPWYRAHKPGHSTRLAENLARALKINVRAEHYKEF